MKTMVEPLTELQPLVSELATTFSERANGHDCDSSFVAENYNDLRTHRLFSAAVPEDLGGGGHSYEEICDMLRVIAQSCGSTALAFSMHQHLVAAAVWKYKNKGESVPLLTKVANEQTILISTGGRDWLDSNGEVTRTEGGYLVSAKKKFASQSVAGDIAVTSAPYQHPEQGWQVLHFAVPMSATGVSLLDDWSVMGMRGTGSQTIVFDKVFVPDAAIVLTRPRNGFHPVWDLVIGVAMPLIMSVYVGIAEKAMEIALSVARRTDNNKPHLPYMIGKMNNSMVSARTQWRAMVALTDNHQFTPSEKITVEILTLKTNVVDACIRTVTEAMEIAGGQGFYQQLELERLFRDIHAAPYHPLPGWDQWAFTGERLLHI